MRHPRYPTKGKQINKKKEVAEPVEHDSALFAVAVTGQWEYG